MNALAAVFITMGVIIAIGVVGAIAEKIPWGTVGMLGSFLIFFILPTPLMIVGAVTTNLGIMIFAEVLTCIGTWAAGSLENAQRSSTSITWMVFVPLLPTAICLVACISHNVVAGAVILVIVGFFQFCAAMGAF